MKSEMANCKGADSRWGGKQASPVGSFPPNPFGLYDTAGNVWESVQSAANATTYSPFSNIGGALRP